MASVYEGGVVDTYETEFIIPYGGIYSKFVSGVLVRGKYCMITEYGIIIKSKYTKYSSYTLVRPFKKEINPKEVNSFNLDNMIYNVLIHYKDSYDVYVKKEDLIIAQRDAKLIKLKNQIQKEKSISFKLKKIFKIK